MDKNICVVCRHPYKEELSFTCTVCGRSGFCKFCARPENHDCIARNPFEAMLNLYKQTDKPTPREIKREKARQKREKRSQYAGM